MKRIKSFFNDQSKFNSKDTLLLGFIVLIYIVVSFIHFGSFKAPNTFYTINKDGITIELQEEVSRATILYYNGELSGNYNMYLSLDGKNYTDNKNILMQGTGAFAWDEGSIDQEIKKELKINSNIKYIKLVPNDTKKLILGEIAIYSETGKKISTSITDSKGNKVFLLSDEAITIPSVLDSTKSSYFDEIYFARSAYEYANGLEAYDWVHPPLGKLIQAIPIKLSHNMAPFYYRLMSNIAGIIMIIVMYLFGKAMFKKRKYALISALLMALDNFHFVQTRIGTIDSFLVLFILLSYFFMFKYIEKSKNKHLFLSGLFCGLSICTKWTGLMAGLGLAIIYLIYEFKVKEKVIPYLLKGLSFFIIIPLVLYTSIYLAFPKVNNLHTTSIPKIVKQTEDMYNYHAYLEEGHPFASKWYTWPVMKKPLWYYTRNMTFTTRSTIVLIGNIVIWYTGIIAILLLPLFIIKKKNKKSLFLLIGALSLWLPYMFIGRAMFIYHYFPVLPFMYLAITNLFYQINKRNKYDLFLILYMMICLLVFIIYYPVSSGVPVNDKYIEKTKILSTWEY